MLVNNAQEQTVAVSIRFSYADWCAAQHGMVAVIRAAVDSGVFNKVDTAAALDLLAQLLPTEGMLLGDGARGD